MTPSNPRRSGLPSESDFDPWGGCLDARSAWENFGGLTVDEAYEKFCRRPEVYSEDFMWMGDVAFCCYVDVLRRYVQRADASRHVLASIAYCIHFHFESSGHVGLGTIREQLVELVAFVRANVSRYSDDGAEQTMIDEEWASLGQKLTSG